MWRRRAAVRFTGGPVQEGRVWKTGGEGKGLISGSLDSILDLILSLSESLVFTLESVSGSKVKRSEMALLQFKEVEMFGCSSD